MGVDDPRGLDDVREGRVHPFHHPLCPPSWEVTDRQRDLGMRLKEAYEHGLIEVDPPSFFEGRPPWEVSPVSFSTDRIMLSSFCTGQCRECGRGSLPYSGENRFVFAPDALADYVQQYGLRGETGEGKGLFLYDASDVLDYPHLFELLHRLDQLSGVPCVQLLTSCPPGREEILRELIPLASDRIRIQLSVLPSNEGRLMEAGILDELCRLPHRYAEGAQFPWVKIVTDVVPVGRSHREGELFQGSLTHEGVILRPDRGPCSSLYHLASDRYPNEEALVPVYENRRVYGPQNLMLSSPSEGLIFRPESQYYDLDQQGRLVDETSLRHLTAFLHSAFSNFLQGFSFGSLMRENFGLIEEALEERRFEMPSDDEELIFYRQMLAEFRRKLDDLLDRYGSHVEESGYGDFFREMRALLDRHEGLIMGT